MSVHVLKDYIPSNCYLPLQEHVTYDHRTYTVYKMDPSFAKKTWATLKKIASLFQDATCLEKLPKEVPERKTIFVYSKKFMLEAVKQNSSVLKYANRELKNDKEIILEAVKQTGHAFQYAHSHLKQNKGFALQVSKRDGHAFKYVHEDLKQDREFVLEAIKQHGYVFQYVPENLKQDREFVLEAVKQNGHALPYTGVFTQDEEIALEAVGQNSVVLKYVHEELQQNRQFILKVVEKHSSALQYAPPYLKRDKIFILAVVNRNGMALEHVDRNLKQDKEVALAAVEENGLALLYVDEPLKHDKKVVLAAVNQDGLALYYAPEERKQDSSIVLAAIKQNGLSLRYAQANLQKDRRFVFTAVGYQGEYLLYADDTFKEDREIVLRAIRQNGLVLQHVSDSFKNDREIVLAALRQNGLALQYINEDLRDDKAITLVAVRQNGLALQHTSDHLKKDQEIALAAAKQNGLAVQYLYPAQDRAIALAAVEQNGLALQYLHQSLRHDKKMALAAVAQNGLSLTYVSEALKHDTEIVLEAVSKDGLALLYASDEHKSDKAIVLVAVKQNGLALQYASFSNPRIIEVAHRSLSNHLQHLLEDSHLAKELLEYASFILEDPESLFLHEEHPVFQKAIEAYCITSSSNDPKNPYHMHAKLQKIVQEEPLLAGFEGFRKRANKKVWTFGDIPQDIIPLSMLFETIEQRGVNDQEIAELCCGASLEEIKDNVLGDGKVIVSLLSQRGKKEERLPIAAAYLYAILKGISDADDTRQNGSLSPRETQLLKFASMVKECSTGQIDAIEQYYIHTICLGAINSSENKIEVAIDHTMQIALKRALASDKLLKAIIGDEPLQQSHQTLYLQNRYHRQIGLVHSLLFDRHAGVIDDALIKKDPNEVLKLIKEHLRPLKAVKEILDQALKSPQDLKITYMEFISYFEKELGLHAGNYKRYIEFDEEMNPIGVTSFAVEKLLKKLGYLN